MKNLKRVQQQATEAITTSGSEGEEENIRTYAAVVAQPGSTTMPIQGVNTLPPEGRQVPPPGPPGPERAEGRRSPSPIAGSSGLQPQVARSSKKRKRAGTPPAVRVDSEGEDSDNEVRKANTMMKTEMANLSSRAVSLQMTLEDYQQGLEESTNLLDIAKRKEDEMRAKHTQELKTAVDKINEMRDSENRRALATFYKNSSRYRARKPNKNYVESSFDLIIKVMVDTIHSNIVPEKPEIKKSEKVFKN